MVVVTGSGTSVFNDERKENSFEGMDIVLTKWIGMEGMLRIQDEKEAELKTRFLSQIS